MRGENGTLMALAAAEEAGRHLGAETIHKAMLDGLDSHLRSALRARFEEAAEPIIEQAIQDTMKTFETTIRSFADTQHMKQVVEVILRDSRSTE